jgi:hypothetical protein
MVRRRSVIVVILLALLGAQLRTAVPAYACSAGLDFNPAAEADVIVGGRMTGWERLASDARSPFIAVQVTMEVDQHWKGTTATTIVFIDRTSLVSSGAGATWAGSSGACGLFDSEPTGQYLVVGFDRMADGAYESHLMFQFFRGSAPAGDAYRQAINRLTALLPQLTPTVKSTTPTASGIPTLAPPTPTTAPTARPLPMATSTPAPVAPSQDREPSLVFLVTVVLGMIAVVGGLAMVARKRRF